MIFINTFKNLKFRKKLFISYFVVVIIPIMILGFYSYYRSNVYLQQQAEAGLNDSVRQSADNINRKMIRCNSMAKLVAYNTKVQQIISNNYNNDILLTEDINTFLVPYFYSILHMNEDISKMIIFRDSKVQEYIDFIQPYSQMENYFDYSSSNSSISWSSFKGEACGILDIKDISSMKRLGVLYLRLNKEKLFDQLCSTEKGEYGIYIQDKNNNPVYSKQMKESGRYHSPKAESLTELKGNSLTFKGVEYMVIKAAITEAGWTMYYYTPMEKIVVDASGIIKASLVIVFVCLVILVFIIWLFSRTFVKRIEWLHARMEKVENGTLDMEVSSVSKDEIGELTNCFGRMIKRLNKLIDEVYQSKIVQREAELKALQAQINPHFLYNTLSMINWKATMIKAKDISCIANSLSKFYRTTLNNGQNVIPIKDEIDNTKAYIDIQLMMHDDSFDVIYDFEEKIFNYKMIKLILQPIVENAIGHGIDMNRRRRGKLELSGKIVDNGIQFIVTDNGTGMEEDRLSSIMGISTKGYGLSNIQERLKLFFGESYGISISSAKGEGTRVEIFIPIYEGDG